MMPGSSEVGNDSTEKIKFRVYEKSSGRYLGEAELAVSLSENEIKGENLELVRHTESGMKEEEYFEMDQEESKYINLEGNLKQEECIKVEVEEDGGLLSIPMPEFSFETKASTSLGVEDSGSGLSEVRGDIPTEARDEETEGRPPSRKRRNVKCLLCGTVRPAGHSHRHIRGKQSKRSN